MFESVFSFAIYCFLKSFTILGGLELFKHQQMATLNDQVPKERLGSSSSRLNDTQSQKFSLIFLHVKKAAREPLLKQWTRVPKQQERKTCGYVGLKISLSCRRQGQEQDPWARIGWYFYKNTNQYDWSVWLTNVHREWKDFCGNSKAVIV